MTCTKMVPFLAHSVDGITYTAEETLLFQLLTFKKLHSYTMYFHQVS